MKTYAPSSAIGLTLKTEDNKSGNPGTLAASGQTLIVINDDTGATVAGLTCLINGAALNAGTQAQPWNVKTAIGPAAAGNYRFVLGGTDDTGRTILVQSEVFQVTVGGLPQVPVAATEPQFGLILSGASDPNANGNYYPAGVYEGHAYWQNMNSTAYYLWYSSDLTGWFLTTVLGTLTANRWQYPIPWFYPSTLTLDPFGTVTGTVTVRLLTDAASALATVGFPAVALPTLPQASVPERNLRVGPLTVIPNQDTSTGQNAYPAAVVLPNGDVLVIYGYPGDPTNGTSWYQVSSDRGVTWSNPSSMPKWPASFLLLANGTILSMYNRGPGFTGAIGTYNPATRAMTWGAEFAIATTVPQLNAANGVAAGPMYHLHDGSIVSVCQGAGASPTAPANVIVIRTTDATGLTGWTYLGTVYNPASDGGAKLLDEACLVVLPNRRLVCLMRSDSTTLPLALWSAFSDDDGATWSTPVIAASTGNAGDPKAVRFDSGVIACISNTSRSAVDDLGAVGLQISLDDGATFRLAGFVATTNRYAYGDMVLLDAATALAVVATEADAAGNWRVCTATLTDTLAAAAIMVANVSGTFPTAAQIAASVWSFLVSAADALGVTTMGGWLRSALAAIGLTLNTSPIVIRRLVDSSGALTLDCGDDYPAGSAIQFGVPSGFMDLTGSVPTLDITSTVGAIPSPNPSLTITGTLLTETVVIDGVMYTQILQFTPTAAQTAALTNWSPEAYRYRVRAIWSSPAKTKTVVQSSPCTALW